MTIEIRPLGVACNLQCQYCYQHPQRDAGNVLPTYDMERIKASVEKEGGHFSLFGGEALLMPEEDLEELWSWGYEKYRQNGVQTNGSLINDNHLRMFKQYNVHVGVSVDGPGELNDVRWAGSLERTREMTAKTHANIERLAKEGVRWSLIVTLHRNNATRDKLSLMHDWFKYMDSLGCTGARLHIMEVDDQAVMQKYALSTEENLEALLSFLKLQEGLSFGFSVFTDMRNLLKGQDQSVTCIWNACDSYTTRAVRGIEGDGQRSNCGRTNKDGIDFVKSDIEGFERYLALYHTPWAYGGCKDCRFFLLCKGNCPGTAIDRDWRNRTMYCQVWMGLFRHLEDQMLSQGLTPVSVRPDRRQLEKAFLDAWAQGRNMNIASALSQLCRGNGSPARGGHGDAHGDHTDAHGDAHGDHTDAHDDHRDAHSDHRDAYGDQ
jgi:uncharacterized protein